MSRDLLLVPMGENDANAATVGGYLQKLLETLWSEGESFSGKRPFGNSGWDHELYKALVAAKKVKGGKLDSDGYVAVEGNAAEVVFDAIRALFAEPDAEDETNKIIITLLERELETRKEI